MVVVPGGKELVKQTGLSRPENNHQVYSQVKARSSPSVMNSEPEDLSNGGVHFK